MSSHIVSNYLRMKYLRMRRNLPFSLSDNNGHETNQSPLRIRRPHPRDVRNYAGPILCDHSRKCFVHLQCIEDHPSRYCLSLCQNVLLSWLFPIGNQAFCKIPKRPCCQKNRRKPYPNFHLVYGLLYALCHIGAHLEDELEANLKKRKIFPQV